MFAKKFNQEELFDLLNGVANSRLIWITLNMISSVTNFDRLAQY
jgi:hypothetical protein